MMPFPVWVLPVTELAARAGKVWVAFFVPYEVMLMSG